MKKYIEERAIEVALYIIESKATVRQAAKKFGISKSSIHQDITYRIMSIDPILARQVREVLDVNKSERHIRGGMATKEKYSGRPKKAAETGTIN
ncbi:MAG: sporulation transcriptional regulator SpoIIID [Lachnospiraceae bacterium]|nr:sporulation transcriptional regulator SpoIIID [Lachnospiraceae bacterium]